MYLCSAYNRRTTKALDDDADDDDDDDDPAMATAAFATRVFSFIIYTGQQ